MGTGGDASLPHFHLKDRQTCVTGSLSYVVTSYAVFGPPQLLSCGCTAELECCKSLNNRFFHIFAVIKKTSYLKVLEIHASLVSFVNLKKLTGPCPLSAEYLAGV